MSLRRPWRARARRPLTALVVSLGGATSAACPMSNPAFNDTRSVDDEGGASGEASSSSSGATSAGSTETSGAAPTTEPATASEGTSDGTTTSNTTTSEGMTSDGPTSDATTSEGSTDGTTNGTTDGTTDSTTGEPACDVPDQETDIPAARDAFFLRGPEPCKDYIDKIGNPDVPCGVLSFGATDALLLARLEGGYEAMYAVDFDLTKIITLKNQDQAIIKDALLGITVYANAGEPLTLRVGKIVPAQGWVEGTKDRSVGIAGDSTFLFAAIGQPNVAWQNGDGPRGASLEAASIAVPKSFEEHDVLLSTPFLIDDWLDNPGMARGLALSFAKGMTVLHGPGVKARESVNYAPFLRVRYCAK